ncbi:MAG: shikimate kinase [Deltaproteobacteria bacterium]|nr:shikimate kinase [Deltaproteobacteria bacterium]
MDWTDGIGSMNIVLLGYRCSGKTTVGRILARKMGRRFVDTDQMIGELTGRSISSIVLENGWDCFRELERELIRKISRLDGLVVATGGGVVLDTENLINLKTNGFLVWLRADSAIMKERLKGQEGSECSRPSLTGSDPIDEFDTVLESRKPLYENTANYEVDTTLITPEEAANSIVKHLNGKA